MLDRRDFFRCTATAATTILLPDSWRMRATTAAESSRQTKITDLTVIRLREKGRNGQARAFLEIATDSDFDGVSGELFMDTPRQLNEMLPRLRNCWSTEIPGMLS